EGTAEHRAAEDECVREAPARERADFLFLAAELAQLLLQRRRQGVERAEMALRRAQHLRIRKPRIQNCARRHRLEGGDGCRRATVTHHCDCRRSNPPNRCGTRWCAKTSSIVSRVLMTSALAPFTSTVAGRGWPLN